MQDDDIIGFIWRILICLPDYKKANGSLWPWGWWHLLRGEKAPSGHPVAGLLPIIRGWGGHAPLHLELHRTPQAHQFQHLDIGPVDGNWKPKNGHVLEGWGQRISGIGFMHGEFRD
ncbi:MAG: hypothetical protein IPL78_22775 [Chloroflexi bacterium]|nr:hypothetical protein [Chloroflexota bacterium]